MKPMKPSKTKATKLPALGGGKGKPHIRMRKLKPVPGGAFPQSPMAFPQDPGSPAPDPGQALGAQPGGMPTGAGPGDMGE